MSSTSNSLTQDRERIQATEKSCKEICQELKKYQDSLIELSNHESQMVNNLLKAGCSSNELESTLWAWSAISEQQKVLAVDSAREYSDFVKQPIKKYNALFTTWNSAFKNLDSVAANQQKLEQKQIKVRAKASGPDAQAKIAQVSSQVDHAARQQQVLQSQLYDDAQQFAEKSVDCITPLMNTSALLQLKDANDMATTTGRLCETLAVDQLPLDDEAYKEHVTRMFNEIRALSIVPEK